MDEKIDERQFRELMVHSEDIQSDAMKTARTDLNAYADAALESRYEARRDLRIGGALLGAGALGAAALAFASPASATTTDVQALQTAASIENLAVSVYKTALTLPFIGGSSANKVVTAFAKMTMSQHADHAKAFNAAVKKMSGKQQNGVDSKYKAYVDSQLPKIKAVGDVVTLAIALEDVAAQTYVKNVGQVSTGELRNLFASVAGVEAQHKAILLAVQALVKGGLASQIKLPPDAAKLPAAAGSVGFPDGFYPTKSASPVTEGAVK